MSMDSPTSRGLVSMQQLTQFKRPILIGLTLLIAFSFLFPIYWMVISSLKPEMELFTLPATYYPHEAVLQHYETVIFHTEFPTFYKNSLLVAAGTISLTVMAAVLGGYGLARATIPHKRFFANSILFGYLFPPLLIGIPMYIIWEVLGLTNTLVGLVIAQTALSLPFSTWLMWNFFADLSEHYEESAWLCGASRPRAFLEISLPNAKPAIFAVVVLTFAISWNDFSLALLLLTDLQKQTLPIGIMSFIQPQFVDWGPLMAATVLISIPPFAIVLTLQSYILKGFSLRQD